MKIRNYFTIAWGILAISFSANAQYVTIPDPQFRNYLSVTFPNCMNTAQQLDTTCAAVTGVLVVDVSGRGISSLEGIQYFDGLNSLNAQGNNLTSLPTLPRLLRSVNLSQNPGLFCLPQLPPFLQNLTVSNTGVSCLPNIPAALTTTLPICTNSCQCAEYTCSNLGGWTQNQGIIRWVQKTNGRANGGPMWGSRRRIASRTPQDGAFVLDVDSIRSTGMSTPLFATLTSPSIPINPALNSTYYISFHQYYRKFNAETMVEYSLDGGLSWVSTIINQSLANDSETPSYDFKIIPVPILAASTNSVIVRFRYIGLGYFWILDDIKVCDQYPSPTRPKTSLGEYLHENGYAFEVDSMGHPFKPNELAIGFVPGFRPARDILLPNRDTLVMVDSCQCEQSLYVFRYSDENNPNAQPNPLLNPTSIEERVKGALSQSTIQSAEPNYYVPAELDAGPPCRSPSISPLVNLSSFPHLRLDNPPVFKVAILDTGVDPTDSTLARKVSVNALAGPPSAELMGINVIYKNNNTLDDHGHGTHVAGILKNTQRDYFADTCRVKYKIIKTHDSLGVSTVFHSVCGIYCGVKCGAKVLNCSWGYYVDSLENTTITYDALKFAQDSGAVVVASAGNDSLEMTNPHLHVPSSFTKNILPTGMFPLHNVVSVGSDDGAGNLSWFSNWGAAYMDVTTPGENVLSHDLCGTFSTKSGTSMSAPQISAAFAQRLACGNGPRPPFQTLQDQVFTQCASPLNNNTWASSGNAVHFRCCASLLGIHVPGILCVGDSMFLTASGSSGFLWNTGETTRRITIHSGGLYSVTATSGGTLCQASTSVNVPERTCIHSNPVFLCQDFNVDNVRDNGWVHVRDLDGNFVLSINPQGNTLGNVLVQAADHPTIPSATISHLGNTASVPAMPRYFNINSALPNPFPQPVRVRLYFLNDELTDYNAALSAFNGSSASLPVLEILHYDGPNEDCSPANNTGSIPTQSTTSTGSMGPQGFYLETTTTSFSEFGAILRPSLLVTGIEQAGGFTANISPNPFTEELSLHLSGLNSSEVSIEISDINGRVLMAGTTHAQNGKASWNMPTTLLPSGPYLIRVIAGDEVMVRKVVKR